MYVSLCVATQLARLKLARAVGLLHKQTAVIPEETTLFFFFLGSNKSAELQKLGSEGATEG